MSSRTPPARQKVRQVTVDAATDGQRIDNFLLRELKGVPRTRIYRALRKGEVRVDGKRIKAQHRLSEGEVVRVPPIGGEPREAASASDELKRLLAERILHEDEHLMVVHKPSGLAVHGGSGLKLGLIEAMRQLRPDEQRLELVHRLDRATSGCLLLAKRSSALRELHRQLRDGEVGKTYLALLKGCLPEARITVDAALERRTTKSGKRQVEVEEAGKAAATSFHQLSCFRRRACLVEVDIATGRTHQIRVHAQHIGHEVAGDLRYGDLRFNREMRELGLERLFLHARSLTLTHPATGEALRFDAELAPELRRVIDALEGA